MPGNKTTETCRSKRKRLHFFNHQFTGTAIAVYIVIVTESYYYIITPGFVTGNSTVFATLAGITFQVYKINVSN